MQRHLTLLFYFIGLYHVAACLDYDGWLNINIHHNLFCNDNRFCARGSISLKSMRAGVSSIEQIGFSEYHIKELEELARNDGFYTIKAKVTTADNTKGTEFLSSLKARAFLDNGLSDTINAWILPNGAVTAVNFQVTNATQKINRRNISHKIMSMFYLRHIDQAPVPDTASYIQKLEREREAREKGDVKDNRSFLAKYWMYIVPIAIFVMISGATNPEPAGQAARQ